MSRDEWPINHDEWPANRDRIEQILRDDKAVRVPDPDPELEALQRAILLEDVFELTLSDDEIDSAALGSPGSAQDVVSRHRRWR